MSSNSEISKTLAACLISPNVSDANLEPANIVDTMHSAARAIASLSKAVSDGPYEATDKPGNINSLVDAGLYIGEGLREIAKSIDRLAATVEGARGGNQ